MELKLKDRSLYISSKLNNKIELLCQNGLNPTIKTTFIESALNLEDGKNYDTSSEAIYSKSISGSHKRIIYKKELNSKTLYEFIVTMNRDGKIEDCTIKFHTKKGNNKINGTYQLSYCKTYFTFEFIDRTGTKWTISRYEVNSNLTPELFDELIPTFMDILENHINKRKKQPILYEEVMFSTLGDLLKMESSLVSDLAFIEPILPIMVSEEEIQAIQNILKQYIDQDVSPLSLH